MYPQTDTVLQYLPPQLPLFPFLWLISSHCHNSLCLVWERSPDIVCESVKCSIPTISHHSAGKVPSTKEALDKRLCLLHKQDSQKTKGGIMRILLDKDTNESLALAMGRTTKEPRNPCVSDNLGEVPVRSRLRSWMVSSSSEVKLLGVVSLCSRTWNLCTSDTPILKSTLTIIFKGPRQTIVSNSHLFHICRTIPAYFVGIQDLIINGICGVCLNMNITYTYVHIYMSWNINH